MKKPKRRKAAPPNPIWRHNSFFGCAAMMRAQAKLIIEAETTTAEAKAIAGRILAEAEKLTVTLAVRID